MARRFISEVIKTQDKEEERSDEEEKINYNIANSEDS